MKKGLMIFLVTLVTVAVAMPALAAVEFQYGGVFRTRWVTSNNINDGSSQVQDNDNVFDQRLRLYLTFKASENLKVVWKIEIGNIAWGDTRWNNGGRMGADGINVKTKNAYVQFNIPNIPTTAVIGIQGIALLDSWIVDDDFSAAAFVTKLDNFTVTLAYISGQNAYDSVGNEGEYYHSSTKDNVDDYAFAITYAQKGVPFKGTLTGVFMNANMVPWAMFPEVMMSPFNTGPFAINVASNGAAWPGGFTPIANMPTQIAGTNYYFSGLNTVGSFNWFGNKLDVIKDNQMFDLGLNLSYKIDWLSAYINFAKNIGSTKVASRQILGVQATAAGGFTPVYGTFINNNPNLPVPGIGTVQDMDYTGWMIDAGVSYFCGPYTFNLGGFYTTGQKARDQRVYIYDNTGANTGFYYITKRYQNTDDLDFFTYPGTTSKYFSEIVGGGILDAAGPFASAAAGSNGSNFWRGYGFPTNLWTVTAGAAWQVLEKTKLSASYWYFQTSESVGTGRFNPFTLEEKMSNDIGHEFNLYLTQGIVDGLTLDIVGAFLLTGDAYMRTGYISATQAAGSNVITLHPVTWDKDNVYEVGARLQWEF